MSVCRVKKNKNYTVMANHHLKDRGLSLKAKGLLSVVLSLPDDWDYSIAGLVGISKEGRTSIKNILDELKQNGYLRVDKLKPKKGVRNKIEYLYTFYEEPIKNDKNQATENLPLDNLYLENHTQLNTNKLNTNKLNTNNNNKESNKERKTSFKKPSIDEINDYCKERHNRIDGSAFYDFYESKGWFIGKTKMKDWKACVRTWERRNKEATKSKTDKIIEEWLASDD